jgi:hypothetical protein
VSDTDWLAFVIGVIFYQIIKMLYQVINQAVIDHRKKRVLKLVQVIFPGNEKVTLITIDATDKRAMDKMEREIRTHYEVEDDEDLFVEPYPKKGQVREDQDRSGDR